MQAVCCRFESDQLYRVEDTNWMFHIRRQRRDGAKPKTAMTLPVKTLPRFTRQVGVAETRDYIYSVYRSI